MQNLTLAEGKASVFYVKLDDPNNADVVAMQIKTIPGMQNYNIETMAEWLSQMSADNIPGLSKFIDVVIGISVVIGFIVIFQSMYTAVMERTREIGILKSLGASKLYILRLVLRETALLSVVGTIVGFGISFAAKIFIVKRFPLLRIVIGNDWLGYAAALAILGPLL